MSAAHELALGPLVQIPPGEGRTFALDGLVVAVFHSRSGEVFATQAACPHRGGPLADGIVGGNTVVCPLHARIYALADGAPVRGECVLQTYPVRVAGGELLLRLG